MMTKSTHGGPGRNQGRKPIKAGEQTVTVSIRLTAGQREALTALGGAEWVRQQIESAYPKAQSEKIERELLTRLKEERAMAEFADAAIAEPCVICSSYKAG